MQKTSPAYQAEMAKLWRQQNEMRITVGVVDIDAAGDAVVSSSAGVYYSSLEGIVYERIPERTYATLEPGRWRCDGRELVPAKTKMLEEGFVGTALSGADGVYDPVPFVRFDFTKRHTAPALTLAFDPSHEDWPKRVRVTAYRAGGVILDTEAEPDKAIYILGERVQNFDQLEIYFLQSGVPFRRARLQQVLFGYGLVFSNTELKNATQTMEVDPITRRLPKGALDFTIYNYDGAYDLDNPLGVWRDMEQHTPLDVVYGQTLSTGLSWADMYASGWFDTELSTWMAIREGGMTEYLPAGHFYLSSSPTGRKNEVQFKATDVLGLMTGTYYKGAWGATDLYSLAQKVLRDADLPLLANGAEPWKLWEGLRQIPVKNPMPIVAGREAMQLIAHAARCVLYVDRTGCIRVEPLGGQQNDFFLDFMKGMELPTVEKTPALAGVLAYARNYSASAQRGELHKETYAVQESAAVHVEFSRLAQDVVIAVSGGSYTADVYAGAADVVLTGNGNIVLTITGVSMEENKSAVNAAAPDAGENAEWETVDNPLVSSREHAGQIAAWVRGWLLMRSAYTFKYRGHPEIDALDAIYIQSRFAGKVPAYVLKHVIKFNGAISGEMVAKRIEG